MRLVALSSTTRMWAERVGLGAGRGVGIGRCRCRRGGAAISKATVAPGPGLALASQRAGHRRDRALGQHQLQLHAHAAAWRHVADAVEHAGEVARRVGGAVVAHAAGEGEAVLGGRTCRLASITPRLEWAMAWPIRASNTCISRAASMHRRAVGRAVVGDQQGDAGRLGLAVASARRCRPSVPAGGAARRRSPAGRRRPSAARRRRRAGRAWRARPR